MAAPRRLVGRIVRSGLRAAAFAGVVALVRERLLRRNYERYGPERLEPR